MRLIDVERLRFYCACNDHDLIKKRSINKVRRLRSVGYNNLLEQLPKNLMD